MKKVNFYIVKLFHFICLNKLAAFCLSFLVPVKVTRPLIVGPLRPSNSVRQVKPAVSVRNLVPEKLDLVAVFFVLGAE